MTYTRPVRCKRPAKEERRVNEPWAKKKIRHFCQRAPSLEGSDDSSNADAANLTALPKISSKHSPLEDSAKQMRLLWVLPGGEDEIIRLEMTTCWREDKKEMPPYNAISYTWGDCQTQELLVDGKPLQVRKNCYYALWQARLHHPGEYVWIDAICIDQDTTAEKNHQVRIMGDIYQSATRVISCVGPHADGSESIFETLKGREYYIPDQFADIQESITPWLFPRRYRRISHIEEAYNDFLNRSYWHRLWIVQEIAASGPLGQREQELLCGRSTIHLDTVLEPAYVLALEKGSPLGLICRASFSSMTYAEIVEDLKDFECADPKDMIYGILPLIDGTRCSPIEPDYSRSCWRLLVDLAAQINMYDVCYAMDLLKIDCCNPDLKALRRSRIMSQPLADEAITKGSWEPVSANEWDGFVVEEHSLYSCCEGTYQPRHLELALESIRGTLGTESSDEVIQKHIPKGLLTGSRLLALVPAQTLPSDLVVRCFITTPAGDRETNLVLRIQDRHHYYDVIGQALVIDHSRRLIWDRVVESTQPILNLDSSWEIRVSSEDKIMIAGLEAPIPSIISQEGFRARLLRLLTSPIARPIGAVRRT